MSGALPHDLREVTPVVELRHIGVGLTVQVLEVAELVIVHQVGDHGPDVVGGDTVADVLAISTPVDFAIKNRSDSRPRNGQEGWSLRVVFIDTAVGKLLSAGLEAAVPNESRSRVVGTVDVVVLQDGLLVAVGSTWARRRRRRRGHLDR